MAQIVAAAQHRLLYLARGERSSADQTFAADVALTLIRGHQNQRIELPDARGAVGGCGDDVRAVRTERRSGHCARMSTQRSQRRACGGVPYPRGVAGGSGNDPGIVAAEGRAENPIRVPGENGVKGARPGVPDPRGVVG